MRIVPLAALLASLAWQAMAAEDRVRVDQFAIDRTEVTIEAFARFTAARGLRTAAEAAGGGFEFTSGWTRRAGWTFRTPSGKPGAPNDPAAHVTWQEAADYCAFVGGRLPSFAEWRRAAYTETRASPSDSAPDAWARQAPVGATQRGVNGLYDMGGNVWEWLADRRGDEALTAGGSWWYGAEQTRADAMQWKAADFTAVYIGFRCAYDP
jgi:formylglycine-generating enzyme